MTNTWTDRGTSSTAGTVLGLAGLLFAMNPFSKVEAIEAVPIGAQSRWTIKHERSTPSGCVRVSGDAYTVAADQIFDVKLALAYEVFIARQKPLEQEFNDILGKNLWDLYER